VSQQPERFVIELTALPDTVPAVIRLRLALKHLLRSAKLRCTRATYAEAAAPPHDRNAGGEEQAGR
jgi:hypothetical protein